MLMTPETVRCPRCLSDEVWITDIRAWPVGPEKLAALADCEGVEVVPDAPEGGFGLGSTVHISFQGGCGHRFGLILRNQDGKTFISQNSRELEQINISRSPIWCEKKGCE